MKFSLFFILLFIFVINIYGQIPHQHWETRYTNDGQKFCYDIEMLDSSFGNIFDIWILEFKKDGLIPANFANNIIKSKMLYTINIPEAKYGIKEMINYNSEGKEVYKIIYSYLDDKDKCNNSITENSIIYIIVQEYFKLKNEQNQL